MLSYFASPSVLFQASKAESKIKKEAEEAAKRAANLEESKSIVISEDPALPAASASKINGLSQYRGQRVKVNGNRLSFQ